MEQISLLEAMISIEEKQIVNENKTLLLNKERTKYEREKILSCKVAISEQSINGSHCLNYLLLV